jgi:hypothetical protein
MAGMAGLFGSGAAPAQDTLYYDDWGTGSNMAANTPETQQYMQQLATQLAQSAPPPMGGLKELLPLLGAIQQPGGAAQGGGKGYIPHTAHPLNLGSGQQFQPTVGPLYAAAAQRRGKAPLGSMLRGVRGGGGG